MINRHGAVLIDDEALARRRLRQLLSQAPDFDVAGECGDARDAVALVRAVRPAVAFVDVRMPHLDGFEVQSAIRTFVRHVVFVTAHTEHAARAFDVAASDYLVKPVTQARFTATLDRIRTALGGGGPRRILLGGRQGGVVADPATVAWLEARGAYVVVHAADRRHLLRASLGQMVARLGGRFVRIHRSAVVNVEQVRGVRREGSGLEVELASGRRLPVSRRQVRALMEHLAHQPGRGRSQPDPTTDIGGG